MAPTINKLPASQEARNIQETPKTAHRHYKLHVKIFTYSFIY